jgi:uncharacterized coiled-coil protein SlyX
MAESDEVRRIDDRLVALEEWMLHTDRLLAGLNEVVCSLQDRLDEQNRKMEAVKLALERSTLPGEQRSFEDERPPHY